jgi:tetratricopeptide (TPR) repeat protein
LAFLLAHEVAHVIRDHHGLLSSYQHISVTAPLPPATPRKDEEARALQAMELEADRLGLLYTSLVGYQARAAIPILQKVIALTGSSPLHPDPRQRAETLRATTRQITAHLELFSLGLVFLATGRYEEAARVYETFANLYPGREVYNNLGVAYHKWALLYGHEDGWFRSVMVDPQTRARVTLKDITSSLVPDKEMHPLFRKYMDRALAAYRLAVESDPEYAVGHNNLGLAYLEAGEYDFAIGEFKRALRLDPKLPTAWNNRGIAYVKNGDPERARADFLQAIAVDPTYPDPHGNLARLYDQLGKPDLAASARREFDRLRAGRSPKPAARHREMIAGVEVGAAARNFADGEASGTVSLSVSLGLRDEDSLRVLVSDRSGVLVATRRGSVEVVGAIQGYGGRTTMGIAIGASSRQIKGAYGPPPRRQESQSGHLWIYPDHGLVFVLVADRLASWWLSAPSRPTAP